MTYWKVKNTLSVATLSRIVDRLQSAGCECRVRVDKALFVRLYVKMPMNTWRYCNCDELLSLEETFLRDLSLDRGALQPMEDGKDEQ